MASSFVLVWFVQYSPTDLFLSVLSLNPLFAQAIEFLKSHDLQAMEVGKTELKGKDLFVNIAQTKPKTKEGLKTHISPDFLKYLLPYKLNFKVYILGIIYSKSSIV